MQEKADCRRRVAELRLRSMSIEKIAETVGYSVQTVLRDLKYMQAKWMEAAAEDIAALKARELRKLDLLEAEALAEWERSKLKTMKRITEKDADGNLKRRKEVGSNTGDPRYLNVILGIHERRAKLIGADAPTKVAQTNPDGSDLSKEHRDAVVAAALAAAANPSG